MIAGRRLRMVALVAVVASVGYLRLGPIPHKILDLSSAENKSTGVLLPACKFHINKKTGELEIELTQNPWKLVDVMDRTKKKQE